MKNKLAAIGIGVVIVLGIGFGLYQFSSKSSAASLSIEEAKEIAKSQFPGTVVEIEYEQKGSRAVYEIEIEGEGKHFELYLDANTGEIVKLEEKTINSSGEVVAKNENNQPATNDNNSKSNTNDDQVDDKNASNKSDEDNADDQTEGTVDKQNQSNTDNQNKTDDKNQNNGNKNDDDNDDNLINVDLGVAILKEKAIEIALAEVGENATIEEIELDDDDGRVYYEIELRTSNQEIDMEVDAYTGEIISISAEYEDD